MKVEWKTRDVMLAVRDGEKEVYALARSVRAYGPLGVHPLALALEKPRLDPLSWRIRMHHPEKRRLFRVTFIPSGRQLCFFKRKADAVAFCERIYEEFHEVFDHAARALTSYDEATKRLTTHPRWDDIKTRLREHQEGRL